jgi:hypothetical protein
MNTSPVDSYDGAAEIFTFGANSAGVWIFLIVSVVLFLALLVRASRHESRSFATLREDPARAPEGAPAPSRMEPMPAAVE